MKDQLQIEEKVKERYGRIALAGNFEGCCAPTNKRRYFNCSLSWGKT
jgi:hypothetical protein